MTDDGALLEYMGMDAQRWASEFCKYARDQRYLDKEWVLHWFANALMTGAKEQAKIQTNGDVA